VVSLNILYKLQEKKHQNDAGWFLSLTQSEESEKMRINLRLKMFNGGLLSHRAEDRSTVLHSGPIKSDKFRCLVDVIMLS